MNTIQETEPVPVTNEEALELAVRLVLHMENLILASKEKEINVGDIERIAKQGVERFQEMTSGTCDVEIITALRIMDTSEEQAEENPELKESIFGKKQKSCALRMFQTLLTK